MEFCNTEIPRVRKGEISLLNESEASHFALVAKALSDPIRIQMVHLLGTRNDLCTCEFEELLGLAQSKVSYHLKILLRAGIIEREIHGSWSHYKLQDQEILNKLQMLSR